MGTTLAIDLEQLKKMIDQCPIEEKVEIARFLERETFEIRFRTILDRLKTTGLNLDDITQEVETVRRNRYERQN